MTAATNLGAELANMLDQWRAAHPAEYASARIRHNRWQTATSTVRAQFAWLDERRGES